MAGSCRPWRVNLADASRHVVRISAAELRRAEAAYRQRTPLSRANWLRARRVMPGGVSANLRFHRPYPLVMKRGSGAHLWDLDGHRYVDCHLAYGSLVLGHGHQAVVEATTSQLAVDGTSAFGASHADELAFARRVLKLFPAADSIRFVNSGLEATLLSLRVARAVTGRPRWAKFEGHYHGSHDQVLLSYRPDPKAAGPPSAPLAVPDSASVSEELRQRVLILPFNDWRSTEALLRKHRRELSAVLIEPVQAGFIPPREDFLQRLADACRKFGIVLIFDEVKTGFRLALGGAQQYFGVAADLTAVGKILGGGYPIGALLGRGELMRALDPASGPHGSTVFHSGTFNGHPAALAAGTATIAELRRPGTYRRLEEAAQHLKDRLHDAARRKGVDLQLPGVGSAFGIVFSSQPIQSYRDLWTADVRARRLFDLRLLARGVFFAQNDRFSLGTCHTAAVIDEVARAADEALMAA